MTALEVRERAGLTTHELLERLATVAPRGARWRASRPGLFRRMPVKQETDGKTETWRMSYLLDVILTRDIWMHRVDITRATGHEMVVTPDHDGRIVADVVAEWARPHGQPFTLDLEGPAGGTFTSGSAGEERTIDAVELCRVLAGRATGAGLLAQQVPF